MEIYHLVFNWGLFSKYRSAPNIDTYLEYYKGRLAQWIHSKIKKSISEDIIFHYVSKFLRRTPFITFVFSYNILVPSFVLSKRH